MSPILSLTTEQVTLRDFRELRVALRRHGDHAVARRGVVDGAEAAAPADEDGA